MIYIVEMPGPGAVMALSGVSPDDPSWENNHVEIRDGHAPHHCTYSALRNMVTNILRDAKVEFRED